MIMNFTNKFRTLINELGLGNAVLYILSIVLARWSFNRISLFKYYFVSQPVPSEPLLRPSVKRRIRIERITAISPQIALFPRPPEVIRQRFAQNSVCYAAFSEERFLGFIWFNEGAYREDEVRCDFVPLPEGEVAWDYDVFVDPGSRLSLVFPMLWDSVNEQLRNRGIRWSVSRISAFNPYSLSVHAKLGAVKTGSAVYLCAWALQIMLTGHAPFIDVSLSRVPKLTIPSTTG